LETNYLDQNIITALDKISQINRLMLWDIWKEEGLSPIQINFIEFIDISLLQSATVSKIAKEFDLKKSTVSDSLATLIKKGILKKEKDNIDQRIHYLALTEFGKEKIELIKCRKNSMIKKISAVPAEQKEIVALFLMHLIKDLYDDGLIQTAKMCITCRNFVKKNGNTTDKNQNYCQFTQRYLNNNELKFNCTGYQ
jgi:DNA-binding MarR family transcriptional regulator